MPKPPLDDPQTSGKAAERFAIFEKAALERLQAGSDSTKPATFLPLPVRLTAGAAATIAGIGVLWSVLAKVPVQVNGTAAIVPEGGLGSLVAGTAGQLQLQVSGLGPNSLAAEQQERNQQLQTFWIEDYSPNTLSLTSLKDLVNGSLKPRNGSVLRMPEDLSGVEGYDRPGQRLLVTYPANTLLAWVTDEVANQELNGSFRAAIPSINLQKDQENTRQKRAKDYADLSNLQRQQLNTITNELQERREMYARYQKLWKKGYLATTVLLDEQSRINSLESQLAGMKSTILNSTISSKDQVLGANEANATRKETLNKLENLLITYLTRTAIFSPDGGFYMLSRNFKSYDIVQKGDEIFTYTTTPPALPRIVPVFLDSTSAQQVTDGMKVLITPKGISRAEFGGIPGAVTAVKKLPLPQDALIGIVGSRALANIVQQMLPSPYLVKVQLEQAEPEFCQQALSRRCYRWSSGRQPPHPVRLATLADVQITTYQRRPIEFVMPALKRGLGLVVDNQ